MILQLILDSIYLKKYITLNKCIIEAIKLIIRANHLLKTYYKAGLGPSAFNFTYTINPICIQKKIIALLSKKVSKLGFEHQQSDFHCF